jgi:PAS domain S-box-containing protein
MWTLRRSPRPDQPKVRPTLIQDQRNDRASEAERRALAAEARLATAIESMTQAFALYDANDCLVLCNRRYRESFGRAAENVWPGARFADLLRRYAELEMAQDSVTRSEAWIAERLKHHHAAPTTHLWHRGEQWLEVADRRTDDGGTLVLISDITEAKAREVALAELARRNAMLAEAVSATSNGVVITDPNLPGNPIVFVNAAFSRITGYSADEALGRNCRFLQDKGTDPGTIERLNRAIRSQRPTTVTIRNYRKDGRTFWNELTVNPIFDENGRSVRFVGVQTDVTDRKRAEEALRAAKEQAEVASRSKSDFLANMSHELRTPLNAIIGFSEVMTLEMFGPLGEPRYRRYAKDIHDSGGHLLALINDVLDLSKIEAGKYVLHLEQVNPLEIIEASLVLIRVRAREAGLSLTLEIDPELAPFKADERALKQMLINLLSNAVKFTPSGGEVALRARRDDDGFYLFAVGDSGIGIAEKDIETALAPFGQIESAESRKHSGTGLGLPLVRFLAELHGGSLHLESRLGVGTTVTVRLPAEAAAPKS